MKYDFLNEHNHIISPISTLALWNTAGVFETFNYILSDYFTPDMQNRLKEEKAYTDKEFKLLIQIYELINKYWHKHPEIWEDNNSEDDEVIEIKKLVVELLSIPSMERFMTDIRKNKFYKGFDSFY